jgi:uncharacterized protein YybS (DUF2232 family)
MTASRALPLAVIGGLVGGLLFGAVLAGGVGGFILCWMAPLPLFLVGLRLGPRAAVIAGLTGTIALTVVEPALGLSFALLIALPVIGLAALAVIAARDRAAGLLVTALAIMGLAGFGIAYASATGQEGGLRGASIATIRDALQTAKDLVEEMAPDVVEIPDQPDTVIERAGEQLPGMVAAIWMVVLAGNGILAEGALAGFGGGLVPAPSMAGITVPRAISIVLGASLAAALLAKGEIAFIGTSLAEIVSVPLVFGGLGVVHAALARHKSRTMLLTVFYALILGLGFTIILVVILGVIEQWVGLRRRFAGAPRQGEE